MGSSSIFLSLEAPNIRIILEEWFEIQFVLVLIGYISWVLYSACNLRVHKENKTFIIF